MTVRDELLLVSLPTCTVLLVLAFVEAMTRQRLLFASLASSAFLIYLDPEHQTNQVKTLIFAQSSAALIGFGAHGLFGAGYPAAALAMVATIALLVTTDFVHPPAVATSLGFAFRPTDEKSLALFGVALGMVAVLVAMERASLWLIRRQRRRRSSS